MKGRATFTVEDILNSACGDLNQHLKVLKAKKAKRAKFNNEKVEYNGLVFDSKKEYRRYRELLLLQKEGVIGQLELQKKYLLVAATDEEKAVRYIADFVYMLTETGQVVVEDVKSEATRKLSTYIIKRKLLLERHGIKIKEI